MTTSTRRVFVAALIVFWWAVPGYCDQAADIAAETAAIKAEKDLIDIRTGLEQAKIKEQFARETALKDIFGTSAGKEGTISVGEDKAALLRVQPAGAEAVRELAARTCVLFSKQSPPNRPVLLSEAQAKALLDSEQYIETLDLIEKEFEESRKAANAPNFPGGKLWLGGPFVLAIPVVANAVVSVLKLFRSDIALASSSNQLFDGLFADMLVLTPQCQTGSYKLIKRS